MIREVVQKEHTVLRQKAAEIPIVEIKSEKIQSVISDMIDSLESQYDGVAIAAPQIGESLRIFVVSRKVLNKKNKDKVYINPTFTRISPKKEWKDGEGCLSVRWLYGTVKRATNVSIKAYDEHGAEFEEKASGLLAHIFQHEMDHLDGILFIDKAINVHEEQPETL